MRKDKHLHFSPPPAARAPRPRGDLSEALVNQIELLKHYCHSFDGGFARSAIPMATSLRVLLHQNNNGRAKSLLFQLGLQSMDFMASSSAVNPLNLFPSSVLTGSIIRGQVGAVVPKITIAADGAFGPIRWLPFQRWWTEPVFKDDHGNVLSRRDFVHAVVDTDGGAHVDGDLDAVYMDASRNNSFGFSVSPFGQHGFAAGFDRSGPKPEGRIDWCSIRQIGHEMLVTLQTHAPNEFAIRAEPVVPARDD